LITLGSAGYPPLLAATDSPPLALWCDGQLPDLLPAPQLAIVGSRRASLGGRNTARQLATDLSLAGITITSGLAFGIDAASHEGGLGGCGGTVAVLGSGIDQIYPRRNAALAKNIRRNGCLVSEYPPGQATRAFQFPARNRIIAGLSLGTLVVEAAKQSGSLITARLAGTYGREVFAIPGSIHSSLTKGCHRLLRDGAKLVERIEDIIEELAQPLKSAVAAASGCPPAIVSAPAETPRDSDEARRKLLQLMDFAPVTVDEALADSGLTTAELSSMLLHLEMEGTVEALPGGRYCRLAKRS
jgi:DNA processing protein